MQAGTHHKQLHQEQERGHRRGDDQPSRGRGAEQEDQGRQGEHGLDAVQGTKDQAPDTETDRHRDARGPELQGCFEERDGQDHAQPDEGESCGCRHTANLYKFFLCK